MNPSFAYGRWHMLTASPRLESILSLAHRPGRHSVAAFQIWKALGVLTLLVRLWSL